MCVCNCIIYKQTCLCVCVCVCAQVTQEHDAKAFKEAQNINKSLSSLLGVCYVHVSQREHIPRTYI